MARPRKARTLDNLPSPAIYIPAGWTENQTPPFEVAIEDFEIMRLADGHNYSLEEAAQKIGVSRSTAGRMLERARRAIAIGIERRAPIYLDASEDLILSHPGETGKESSGTLAQNEGNLLAVACSDTEGDTSVERIFGRAPAFVLSPTDGSPLLRIENPGARAKRDAALSAVKLLQAHAVNRVAAGRFGPEAIKLLSEANIQPIVAKGLTLRQAIAFFDPSRNHAHTQ